MVLVAQTLPAVPDRLDGLTPVCKEDGPGLPCRAWGAVCSKDCSAVSNIRSLLEYLIAGCDGEERYLSML